MGKIAAIELLDDVTLTEVLNSARGSELLDKHGRWSILKSNDGRGRVGKLGKFFIASRDDGICLIVARSLVAITDAIRFEDGPQHTDYRTQNERARETRAVAQAPAADHFGKTAGVPRDPEDD